MKMQVWQSCSWCHEANEIGGGAVYCRNCGHRADVPLAECDCRQCFSWRVGDRVGFAHDANNLYTIKACGEWQNGARYVELEELSGQFAAHVFRRFRRAAK